MQPLTEENGGMMLRMSPPVANGDTAQMLSPQESTSSFILPVDELKLPKQTCPQVQVPLGLLEMEAMGLCRCGGRRKVRRRVYQILVLVLTFLIYMGYHQERRSLSAVKTYLDPSSCQSSINSSSSALPNGSHPSTSLHSNSTDTCPPGWAPFNGPDGNTLLGVLDSSWLVSYAISTYISGFIAERTPLRYFLVLGMLGSALMNTLFGAAFWLNVHSVWFFIVVQLVGGVFHSTGWPGVIAVMSNWFGKGNRGFVMGLWSSNISAGNIVGLLISAYFAKFGWGWGFISTAVLMAFIALLVFLLLPTAPSLVGLAPARTEQNDKDARKIKIREGCGETGDEQKQRRKSSGSCRSLRIPSRYRAEDEQKQQRSAIGFFRALCIPGVIEYSLTLFFTKLVAYTFLFWLPFYINNNSQFPITNLESAWIAVFYDIGGVFGSVVIGLLSDFFLARALVTCSSLILSVPTLYMYKTFGGLSQGTAIGLVMLTGVFTTAPLAIITSAISADLGTHKSLKENAKATATVSGIINGTGSLGAAVGPLLTGIISSYTGGGEGWQNVFYLLMGSCSLAALFTFRLVFLEVIHLPKLVHKKLCAFGVYNVTEDDQNEQDEQEEQDEHDDC